MRITLSVLFATLTIYCSSSVLSLPPSLITTAASLAQNHIRQTRDNQGAIAATDQLLLQPNAITDPPPPPPLPPHGWQHARFPKKDTRFLLDAGSSARNGNTDRDADTDNTRGDDIERLPSFELNTNIANELTHPHTIGASKLLATAAVQNAHNGMTELNRKLPVEYDLNALLASAAGRLNLQQAAMQQTPRQQQHQPPHAAQWWQTADLAPRIRAMQMKEFFTPLKYWAHHCQPPNRNCPKKYYRALLADRSRAAAAVAKQMDEFTANGAEDVVDEQTPTAAATDDDVVNLKAHTFAFGGGDGGNPLANFNDDDAIDNLYNNAGADGGADDYDYSYDNYDEDNNANNDILMLLSGEQDVMKFLSWAMQQLYPYQHFANMSGNSGAAEYYHPGMFNWKKLNLSGNLEPPLVVEEPHYVIVRREQLEDDLQPGIRPANRKSTQRSSAYQSIFNFNQGSQYKDDPFIPPRGRKHNLPDLDALLNRYETFVPNRGKRDKIKDIFKYDDLFFPNRGKKQKPLKAATPLALNGQWLRNSDDDEFNVGGVEEKARRLSNQVDGDDDSNLTAPPTIVAMRSMFEEHARHLRPHQLSAPLSAVNEAGGNDAGTIGISFDKNIDDNGNNYSDTIDNHLAASGVESNDGDEYAADMSLGCSQGIDNENDQSVKFSVPQIDAINTLTVAMNEKPEAIAAQQQNQQEQQQWRRSVMSARMRRVAGTFAGATRTAANRLRSMLAGKQWQQIQRSTRQHIHDDQQKRSQQQQPTKATLRYFNRHLRREQNQEQQQQQLKKQEQRRRAAWQLSLPSNEVQGNNNDLDLLSWRQLHQNNKPVIVQHAALAWLQHSPSQQQQMQKKLQQHLLDQVSAITAAGHSPQEAANADRVYFDI